MKLPGWIGPRIMLVLGLAVASCGGNPPPPGSSDPGGSGERISGNERLGWNQSVGGAAQLASFRYAAYVDGNRVELTDASCGAVSGGVAACNSRMPAMAAGSHSIELASFISNNGAIAESGRSAALRVTVTGATAGAPPSAPAPPPAAPVATTLLATTDGVELRLDLLSDTASAPTAFAPTADGRVFVAEREGRIRILTNGAFDLQPAVTIHEVLPTSASEGGLLALALDAQFERTHFLYAIYTVSGPEATRRFRLVRYREVDGRLGERVILLDQIPAAARPSASLGVGADGRLYVALDAAPAVGRTPAQASYSGKVLRLNTDGTTPPDQPANLPVLAGDFLSPRGLDWHPTTGALYVADVKGRDVEEVRVVMAGGAAGAASAPTAARTRLPLPVGTGPAAIAFYRGTLLPAFAGDLFVAADEGRHLLRLRLDKRDPTRIVSSERLLQDGHAPIRVVAAAPDGVLYVGTDKAVLRLGAR